MSKGHVRSLMHKLFDLAALWESLPLGRRNPVDIVKIKGVTKRRKESIVLTPEQFRDVMRRLPPHVNTMGIVMGCLGLRSSEAFGLKWSDIDWEQKTIAIQRGAYRGAIEDTKTIFSKDKLPLAPGLADLLLAWKSLSEFEWIFANPATGMPYMSPSLQQRWIRPAGEALGIKGLGFTYACPSCHSWSLVGLNRHRLPTRREGILPAAAISRNVFGWHFRIFAASCSVSIWFTCICGSSEPPAMLPRPRDPQDRCWNLIPVRNV